MIIKKNLFTSRHSVLILLIIITSITLFTYAIPVFSQSKGDIKVTPPVKLENPLGSGATDVNTLIGTVINAVLGVVGSLALVMFIYGGFTMMLAAGSQEKVKKGKDILVWAIIGLVIIFASYALVNFVLSNALGS